MEFYIDIGGETKGPYTQGQLQAMWKAGTITGNTLYCREGFKEWVPLRTMVRELEPPPPVQAPPAPQVVRVQVEKKPSGVGKALGIGCLAILAFFVLMAIIGALSGAGGGGSSGDSPSDGLVADPFAEIHHGMTGSEVEAKIGPPSSRESLPNNAELWHYHKVSGIIRFQDGKVDWSGHE
jgi:hypothetical protein